ncbi:hypothetical protein OG209_08640 [Streptomyces sp. NBC_01383]|uniref:hypothetical protein n=1 Tax=unclassified Streptomyces TaxID=2593676 RepID=UPI000F49026D|nr:hypothetical protein [Streptomyces sp. CEV 2-1]
MVLTATEALLHPSPPWWPSLWPTSWATTAVLLSGWIGLRLKQKHVQQQISRADDADHDAPAPGTSTAYGQAA